MDAEPVEFTRLCKVIAAIGYGRIKEIVIEHDVPVAVIAEVRISLRENVAGRLRKLPIDSGA